MVDLYKIDRKTRESKRVKFNIYRAMSINVYIKPQIPVDGNSLKNFPVWVLHNKRKLLWMHQAMKDEGETMTFVEFASECYQSLRGEFDFELN